MLKTFLCIKFTNIIVYSKFIFPICSSTISLSKFLWFILILLIVILLNTWKHRIANIRITFSIEIEIKPFCLTTIHCKRYIKIKTHNTPIYKTHLTYHMVLRNKAISPLKNIGSLLLVKRNRMPNGLYIISLILFLWFYSGGGGN